MYGAQRWLLRAENCGWAVSGEKIGWLLVKGSYQKMVAAGGGARLKNRGWKPDGQMIAITRVTRNDIYRFIEVLF